jgi:hypothetical protein
MIPATTFVLYEGFDEERRMGMHITSCDFDFETHSERHPELLRWVWRRRGRKKHGSVDTTL